MVGVGLAARRLVQDGLGQLVEGAVDVDVGLRRRLHEPDAVFARYLRTASEDRLKRFGSTFDKEFGFKVTAMGTICRY